MSTAVFYVPCFVCAAFAVLIGDYFLALFGLAVGLLWWEKDDRSL